MMQYLLFYILQQNYRYKDFNHYCEMWKK